MKNRMVNTTGLLSCLLGVTTILYAGEAKYEANNGRICPGIQDNGQIQDWINLANKYYSEKNYKEAMKYYRLVADAGYAGGSKYSRVYV